MIFTVYIIKSKRLTHFLCMMTNSDDPGFSRQVKALEWMISRYVIGYVVWRIDKMNLSKLPIKPEFQFSLQI